MRDNSTTTQFKIHHHVDLHWTVERGGMILDRGAWDEMLGQVAAILLGAGDCFRMQTPASKAYCPVWSLEVFRVDINYWTAIHTNGRFIDRLAPSEMLAFIAQYTCEKMGFKQGPWGGLSDYESSIQRQQFLERKPRKIAGLLPPPNKMRALA